MTVHKVKSDGSGQCLCTVKKPKETTRSNDLVTCKNCKKKIAEGIPMTAEEIRKGHAEHKFNEAHKRFTDNMDSPYTAEDWQYDVPSHKHFLDDGNMYDGTHQRKYMLVEIYTGNGSISAFPNLGGLLYIKGQEKASDANIERLKETAVKMLTEE
jgi:hypothetical protein